jgi:hypothetical protein
VDPLIQQVSKSTAYVQTKKKNGQADGCETSSLTMREEYQLRVWRVGYSAIYLGLRGRK